MDQIVYQVVSFGIDGRGRKSINYASTNEDEAKEWIEKQKPYSGVYNIEKVIANLNEIAIETWKKITPIERLALEKPDCIIWLDKKYQQSKFSC